MKNAIINVNDELKSFIGTTVGYIQINEPWVNHNNSYECAAWWEDSTIVKGVYALTLEKNSFAPYDLYLLGKLDAIVTDDYFPALWGGVAISNKPYTSKNLGQQRTIRHKIDLVEGIEKTGYSPGNSIDICVNPLIIDAVINAARQSFENYQQSLVSYWSEYHEKGDGNYNSNLSMVAYSTENMTALCRAIEAMNTRRKYLVEATDYMRNNYVKNTAWAVAA
jgi:hypothetical protein